MKKNIFILLAAAAIAAGGFTATKIYAAEASAPSGAHGRILQRIANKLNLTDDQRSQIRGILSADKDNLKSLAGQLHDARTNLREAIHASDATEASVRTASAKVAAAEADLAVECLKLYGKIAPILTDEQRQKIAEFEQRADAFADNIISQIGTGLGN